MAAIAPSSLSLRNGIDGAGGAFVIGDPMTTFVTISEARRLQVRVKLPAAATLADGFTFECWGKEHGADTSTLIDGQVTIAGEGRDIWITLLSDASVTELIVKGGQFKGTGRTVIVHVKDVG